MFALRSDTVTNAMSPLPFSAWSGAVWCRLRVSQVLIRAVVTIRVIFPETGALLNEAIESRNK